MYATSPHPGVMNSLCAPEDIGTYGVEEDCPNEVSEFQKIVQLMEQICNEDAAVHDPLLGLVRTHISNILVKNSITKNGKIKGILQNLCVGGLTPNLRTFGVLINACMEDGNIRQAEAYLQLMRNMGFTVNEPMYTALIKACSRKQDVDTALRLWKDMQDDGIQLSTAHYNVMVIMFTRGGEFEKAYSYLEDMELPGGVGSDVVTYNTLINACAKIGDVKRTTALFTRMLKRRVEPCEVTYGTICNALAKKGEVATIEELMVIVESVGIKPNGYFYAALISACARTSPPSTDRAELAVEEMKGRGICPTSVRGPLCQALGRTRAARILRRFSHSDRAARLLPPHVESQQLQPWREEEPTAAARPFTATCTRQQKAEEDLRDVQLLGEPISFSAPPGLDLCQANCEEMVVGCPTPYGAWQQDWDQAFAEALSSFGRGSVQFFDVVFSL